MTAAEMKSYIKRLETENERLRRRNGQLFEALRESAPHRLDLGITASAGTVLPLATS